MANKFLIVALVATTITRGQSQLVHELPPNPRAGPGLPLPPAPLVGPTPLPLVGPNPAYSPLPYQPPPQLYEPAVAPPPPAYAEPAPVPLPALPHLPPPPPPAYGVEQYEDGPSNYAFGYAVRDDYSGDDFSHTESRDGYKTTGEYRVSLPDGRMQIVSYVADENGYVADVKYEGEAVPYVPGPLAHPPAPVPVHHAPLAPAPPAPSPVAPVAHPERVFGHAPAPLDLPPPPPAFAPAPLAAAPPPPAFSASLPPRPLVPEAVPAVEALPFRQVFPTQPPPQPFAVAAPAVPIEPIEEPAAPLPVQPLLPEPVAIVHDLKRMHSPMPRAGYIPTPPPAIFSPTPAVPFGALPDVHRPLA